ncbi:OLC1v1020547C1 [Oldenlandia corymbosa var. corymbosa]|uniref:OLC1v1020547C1 n=1 Tax=Oldenlandia corymbosa var. corymbosa TaxID=529605 RepID=A0AAV1EGQ2_OLDCO|nr:OLC1v1020547C1 [Oldenlandia corymbosa var. corymbosa]
MMDDDQFISDFGFFPDEVILLILSRLPVKSLFRIKCVCKSWYKFASTDYFKRLYNDVSAKNPMVLAEPTESSLIFVDNLRGVYDLSLDFIGDRVRVRASCFGLLVCSSIPEKGVYYVCNPMTREFKLLPRIRENRPITRFHPDGEATLVGLARCMYSQKYNVVLAGYHRSFGHRPDRNFVCLVYDSESNKWRKFVTLQDDRFTHMNKNQVVFINGALHWLTESCACLLVLDLKCDGWRKIGLPDEVAGSVAGNRIYLLESDGCLSVIQISEAWMNIWVMNDYEKEEWCMVDRVSLRCIRGMVPGVFPISQTGRYVFLATHKHVLVYHRDSKLWKEMYSVKNNSTFPLWFSAHAFRSTIFSCH